jgi:DNA helicase-2/ATP-dependent DNA helicase PcrA
VFDTRTKGLGARTEIRTVDSLVSQITNAYHQGMGLPSDTGVWARCNENGYDLLAVKAAALLRRHPAIASSLAARYPIVICDEHQDSSGERHAIAMALHSQGARLRIFADPMQSIFPIRAYPNGCPPLDWTALTREAQSFEELDFPHRWRDGCPDLGRWILAARTTLRNGGRVDVRNGLPPSVSIVFAANSAYGNLEFRPAASDRRPIDNFERASRSLLILTRYNETAVSLRPAFGRRVALWEGHNRPALEKFVDMLNNANGDRKAVAQAVVDFVQNTSIGFTAAAYANNFLEDVADSCRRNRRNRPAKIQGLARLILAEPSHIGAAKVLARIAELRRTDNDFRPIEFDCHKEFHEGSRLGAFETAEAGFAAISYCRTYSRPKPPDKAISTIHKAKGLECKDVIVMPCDARSFPNNQLARCLLYVAMSRATDRLMFVIPRDNPSPLLSL